MKKLFLLLTVCASIYTVSLAGGASCNKDKKCCKSGSAQGKSCSKSSTEASATTEVAPASTADASAAPANQAPAKSCCKGKKAACAHKDQ